MAQHYLSPLYQDLNFYQTDDYFYIVPSVDAKLSESRKALLIDRHTEAVSLSAEAAAEVQNWYPSSRIHGLFGSIQLISGKYLILIKQIVKIGELHTGIEAAHNLYRIENVDLVPYRNTESHLTETQKQYNTQYLQMITTFFAQGPFFHLSYTYDLTNTLQHRYQHPAAKGDTFYQRADKRFVWNHYLMRDFVITDKSNTAAAELAPFYLPIIYGFIAQAKIDSVNPSKPFIYTLISRRCVYGAGTRLFFRGASTDPAGAVANFVETEQIIAYGPDGRAASSFVQIRGSIPFHWTQYPDLRYKPPPTILPDFPHERSFFAHLRSILPQYETLVMINLINHTGQEQKLLQKFRQIHRDAPQIPHKQVLLESFDFHHECRQNRWDRLSILLDSVSHHIERFGFFATTERDTFQRGCFRTNCVDSLDRTNVVQSLLAKASLETQLTHFGVIAPGQKVEDFPQFYHVFRNLWADNADACSIQYAGTPALKTDFTRTGKRRFYGMFQDGVNSCIRYYKNNFEDGFRQDSFDLLLGRYMVNPAEGDGSIRSPLSRRNMLRIITFPLFLLIALSALLFVALLPTDTWSEKTVNLLLWFSASAMCTLAMLKFGTHFIDYPTLCPVPRPPPPPSEMNKFYKEQ